MKVLRCVVVEDEPLAQERLLTYIGKVPGLMLVAAFSDAATAIAFLEAESVDMLFLDVQLGGMSGIALLEKVRPACAVVLTTAYSDYALQGYDLNITDYLLKPYTFDRFLQAVDKAKDKERQIKVADNKEFLFVKTEYRLERVLVSDLLFIEGMRDYRRLHLTNKKIMTLQTFRHFEAEFSPNQLARVHKSYMVAPNKIEFVERDRIRIGSVLIPVSETYRARFMSLIAGK